MKVILINEENHGLIGVALNYYAAVKWLITNNWIDNSTEVSIGEDDTEYYWKEISKVYGENWADKMLDQWNINVFNANMDGCFNLEAVTVIDAETLFCYEE